MPRLRLLVLGPVVLVLAVAGFVLFGRTDRARGASSLPAAPSAALGESARHATTARAIRLLRGASHRGHARRSHRAAAPKKHRHAAKHAAVALPVDSPFSLPPLMDLQARRAAGNTRALRAVVLRSRRIALSPSARANVRAGRVSTGTLRLLYRLPKAGGPYLVLSARDDRVRAVQTTLWMTRNAVQGLLALPRDVRPSRMLLEPQAGDRTLTKGPPKAKAGRLCSLAPIYRGAAAKYHQDWRILAAINRIETNLGRNLNVSSAGAVGWMQFLPSTWRQWGVDASGDGLADPWNPEDAIFSAARYLDAAGYQQSPSRSIFAYNHAMWYVNDVLRLAKQLSPDYHC